LESKDPHQIEELSMANLEYVLWAYFIFYPLYIYLTHDKEKQRVTAQPHLKTASYRTTMIHLWLPTLLVLVLIASNTLSLSDMGLTWQWHWPNQLAIVAIVLTVAYFLVALKRLDNSKEARQTLQRQMDHVKWFMPTTKNESNYFIFGVSVSAGICEELLFRAYLLLTLSQYLPTYLAVLVSSFAFGLGHIYQGWGHVFRISLYGGVMALVYLATDSIIMPILFHVIVDMFSGAMAYKVYSDPKSNSFEPDTCAGVFQAKGHVFREK
jgi:membrane protease YdiL (CAAX protease family)